MPKLFPPTPPVGKINKIVPISEGGTGADNVDDALANLDAIKATMINQPGGPLALDGNGHLTLDPSKINLSSNPAINGPLSVETGSVTNFQITNFHANTTYQVTAISGSVVVNGETITYTAPATAGTGGFTVNGRNYYIDVITQMPNTPSIVSPVNGSTGVGKTITVTGNAFSISAVSDTHQASHWQISTNPQFSTILYESVDDTTNKTSWTSGNLDAGTQYFVRVRYKGVAYGYSNWSSSVVFNTKSRFIPSAEQAKINAPTPTVQACFGNAVALSTDGNTLVVAAAYLNTQTGAVYVFTRSNNTWTYQATLTASDAGQNTYFGSSVSVSGDGNMVIVGAEYAAGDGAAYAFVRSGSTWTQQQIISFTTLYEADSFGSSVSVSTDGNTLIVGAKTGTGPSLKNNAGAAYIFTRSNDTWTQQTVLESSDLAAGDNFGYSVAISGDGTRAIVGAYRKSTDAGAAYVFLRSGSTWAQEAKLVASDSTNGQFGYSVDISNDGSTVVVGASSDVSLTGAAYVFTRNATTWTQQQKLTAADKAAGDEFGGSVSISSDGNVVVAGAYAKGSGIGTAYTFVRSGSTWSQDAKLEASDKTAGDYFANAVAISPDASTVVVGAQNEDPSSVSNAGSAYIFV